MAGASVTSSSPETTPEQRLELAFLPLHKKALGAGMAAAAGLSVFVFTIVHFARSGDPYPLVLLDRYFYGYSVSIEGAFIGMFWAALAGFVAGWFFAFCRNLAVATSAFIVRTRAELKQMRDFLDHI